VTLTTTTALVSSDASGKDKSYFKPEEEPPSSISPKQLN
jgi:hypothetical protein